MLADCQVGKHYHWVVHTRQANLSRLMRHANGVYTQAFNRRHGVVGHLFQGCFKSILLDRDAYLLALCMYVETQSSCGGHGRHRAGVALIRLPRARVRGCDAAVAGSDGLHGHLLGWPVVGARDRQRAAQQYADLVANPNGTEARFWQKGLRQQVLPGDEAFALVMARVIVFHVQTHGAPPR